MKTTGGLLWNIFLALVWAAASAELTLGNLALGFALGYLALYFVSRGNGTSGYFAKSRKILSFAFYFLRTIITSNLRVAFQAIRPTIDVLPGVIGVPLSEETDTEIVWVASLLTLMPGTLSLDVSQDRKVLFVHAMFLEDRDEMERQIKDFERRVLEVFR